MACHALVCWMLRPCRRCSVNDTFSCQSEGALQKMLKDYGGFKGWVVTDWGAQVHKDTCCEFLG